MKSASRRVSRPLTGPPARAGLNTVLVAMTGYGQEEDQLRSREAGIDHHLVKPVEVKALKSLLRSLQAQAAGARG